MGKILILYASLGGNTELMAEEMEDYFEQLNHTVTTKSFEFDPVDVEELADYDAIAIGTHTMDEGALPYEVEDFYEELEEVDISGMVFGIFGSADSFYDIFGGAVDLIGERLESLGATVIPDWIKIDLEPEEEDIQRCFDVAEAMLEAAKNKSEK